MTPHLTAMTTNEDGWPTIKNFFDRLSVGDVFTYGEWYTFAEVAVHANQNGKFIVYCQPRTQEYERHGSMTCKVVGTVPKEGVIVIGANAGCLHAIIQNTIIKPGSAVIIIDDLEKHPLEKIVEFLKRSV